MRRRLETAFDRWIDIKDLSDSDAAQRIRDEGVDILINLSGYKEMNHGPRFWKLVETLYPQRREAQAWLRTHGRSLQRYAPKN